MFPARTVSHQQCVRCMTHSQALPNVACTCDADDCMFRALLMGCDAHGLSPVRESHGGAEIGMSKMSSGTMEYVSDVGAKSTLRAIGL